MIRSNRLQLQFANSSEVCSQLQYRIGPILNFGRREAFQIPTSRKCRFGLVHEFLFCGRSPANFWQSMRGTVRKKKLQESEMLGSVSGLTNFSRSLKLPVQTEYSTEGQTLHQNLAPVLVMILWSSLVFSRKMISSTNCYRCCQHQKWEKMSVPLFFCNPT